MHTGWRPVPALHGRDAPAGRLLAASAWRSTAAAAAEAASSTAAIRSRHRHQDSRGRRSRARQGPNELDAMGDVDFRSGGSSTASCRCSSRRSALAGAAPPTLSARHRALHQPLARTWCLSAARRRRRARPPPRDGSTQMPAQLARELGWCRDGRRGHSRTPGCRCVSRVAAHSASAALEHDRHRDRATIGTTVRSTATLTGCSSRGSARSVLSSSAARTRRGGSRGAR